MKAYIFPGQGSQFEGMGKDLYEQAPVARELMEQANEILGFRLTDVMFEGSAEDLKQTKITQPAIFLHSIAKAKIAGEAFRPDTVAGHSLGEFSALVAAGALSFEDGLRLVYSRAIAMQKACEAVESTMAAIIGLDDEVVEQACAEIEDMVVPANYNSPGQLVISGTVKGVEAAVAKLQEAGARRAIILQVGGAFHSPLMQSAKDVLQAAIENTPFKTPACPVYQNLNAQAERDPEKIQQNLIGQLTAPVLWTQTMLNMIADGASEFIEVGGTGSTLQGLVKKVDRKFPTSAL
ncbi:MAG: ACP S-malonyltransferase [Phaeodactylibacter sp.]|nr:ACP S-malonyltransferase [Phaeodactylibacter sp.]MCB9303968.1 ACP S-malonyltransferase [Lewinellaceae bacterium]HQU58197.1 ACP S-malonyltransferase [Saprospiraceae bacterium]